MNDEAFEEFLTSALDELSSKQDQLETTYGFGSFARWSFDHQFRGHNT
jgi:predicted nucleotidyltransferase